VEQYKQATDNVLSSLCIFFSPRRRHRSQSRWRRPSVEGNLGSTTSYRTRSQPPCFHDTLRSAREPFRTREERRSKRVPESLGPHTSHIRFTDRINNRDRGRGRRRRWRWRHAQLLAPSRCLVVCTSTLNILTCLIRSNLTKFSLLQFPDAK
jgi:hypothetical protein